MSISEEWFLRDPKNWCNSFSNFSKFTTATVRTNGCDRRSNFHAEGREKAWRWFSAAVRRLDDARGARSAFRATKTRQKNEVGTIAPAGMKQQSNHGRHFVSAYRSSSWYMIPLATKLFGSQLCTGRQARPQPYGARYISHTPRRSLRVALAIKILFLPPWLLSLLPHLRARLLLDLLILDLHVRSTVSFPLSFPPPRLFIVSSRCVFSRCDTRRQLKVPARSGRLHDP